MAAIPATERYLPTSVTLVDDTGERHAVVVCARCAAVVLAAHQGRHDLSHAEFVSYTRQARTAHDGPTENVRLGSGPDDIGRSEP